MVSSCCAVGCTYRHKKGGIGIFTIPQEISRRLAWITAIRRKDWQPNGHSRICGKHFQTGRPSKDKNHPDYVPNIFCYTKGKIRSAEEYERLQKEKRVTQPQIIMLEKIKMEEHSDCTLSTMSADEEFAAEGNSEATREIMFGNIIPGAVEPQITMSISAYQNTVSKLEAENERLQGEVRRLRIDNMVDIAFEMNALREEIRTLKGKLNQAQFSTLLMSDNKKLEYYTGISNMESFNNILLSCKDLIDTAFTIPEEQQLLIVLVKLKMKFQDEDLAIRFNVSRRTVRRVICSWMPILSLESEE